MALVTGTCLSRQYLRCGRERGRSNRRSPSMLKRACAKTRHAAAPPGARALRSHASAHRDCLRRARDGPDHVVGYFSSREIRRKGSLTRSNTVFGLVRGTPHTTLVEIQNTTTFHRLIWRFISDGKVIKSRMHGMSIRTTLRLRMLRTK